MKLIIVTLVLLCLAAPCAAAPPNRVGIVIFDIDSGLSAVQLATIATVPCVDNMTGVVWYRAFEAIPQHVKTWWQWVDDSAESIGYEDVASGRQDVTDIFTSEKVKEAIIRKGIQLVSYKDVQTK